jgi:hypothetical protein
MRDSVFQFLKVKPSPTLLAPDPQAVSLQQLLGDARLPISIQALSGLPEPTRRRLYRVLIPPGLLSLFNISPIQWSDRDEKTRLEIVEKTSPGLLRLSLYHQDAPQDPVFCLELADNPLNGIDLNLLQLSDPFAPRFETDLAEGQLTLFGTLRRNIPAEQAAMQAGLSPGQTRPGLRFSTQVFDHLETFLALLSHQSIFLEPLTYTSAWLFERRGFAYLRGHKLMDDIHRQFQPGGLLHRALDGSTPFRQPDQSRSVRGRAWAVHDGILDVLGERWNDLRMVKQLGRHAGVQTFPNPEY